MADLFVYGTLMWPPLRFDVLGHQPEAAPAMLEHFRRCSLAGVCFPGLVPQRGMRCEGWVLRRLSRRDLRVLDDYEGHWYQRIRTVVIVDRRNLPVWVYQLAPTQRHRLLPSDWSLQTFIKRQGMAWRTKQ